MCCPGVSLLHDGLGSTTDLRDGDGDAIADYTYDVFGAILDQSGSSPNEFLFTGEQVDGTGLQYLRARYYDPAIGRFITQDPLPAQNLYAYVGNNPVLYVDPYGMFGIPNPFGGVIDCIKNPKECAEQAGEEIKTGAEAVGETIQQGAEAVADAGSWAADQAAAGGEWVYQNTVVPVTDFLSSCEGKLLAGGTVMVAAGIATMGLGSVAVGGAVAAGIEGLHGAAAGGVVIWGGGTLTMFGGLAIGDACLGSDSRYGLQRGYSGSGGSGGHTSLGGSGPDAGSKE